MNEFPPPVLDMLRQPLEEQKIRISRCRYSVEYPADFMLVGAANPCRCGYLLERDRKKPCVCSAQSVEKHFSAISGPITDRMDIYVEMTKIKSPEMEQSLLNTSCETSDRIRARVEKAWKIQEDRCLRHHILPFLNSRIPAEHMNDVFELESGVLQFSAEAGEKLEMSVRGYQKMIRVARTIADFEGDERVAPSHIAQALQFRKK